MASIRTALMICTGASFFLISSAQTCKNHTFSSNMTFSSCTDLPVLDAHLHWSYNLTQKVLKIAYRAQQKPKGWISWGLNPYDGSMIGTQALVAFQEPQGKMKAFSTQITSYVPSMEPGNLSFPISELSSEYVDNEMIIYASLGPLSNETTYNIIWQAGNSVINDIPQPHPFLEPNLKSLGILDFQSEE